MSRLHYPTPSRPCMAPRTSIGRPSIHEAAGVILSVTQLRPRVQRSDRWLRWKARPGLQPNRPAFESGPQALSPLSAERWLQFPEVRRVAIPEPISLAPLDASLAS